jgi:UPF0755 protein
MKKFLLLIIIVLAVITIFGYQYYSSAVRYVLNSSGTDRIVVNVKQGDTAKDVAEQLYEKKLIRSPAVFGFYLDQQGLDGQIKAGRIVVQENYTLSEIIDALVEGKGGEMSVTILEGWTIQQIADYMASLDLTTADEFMDCIKTCEFEGDHLPNGYLEGYLYPDTYFVDPASYSNKQFIQRLINTFESKLDNDIWIPLEKENRTLEDVIIMASVVEREERDPDERPTVAGILWNRYDANIGLGADATVLYALGRTKGGLTYTDLQVDSPYNTRKYAALPPTPICNPNITSIKAAADPALTDYWYYLHDSDGAVHYAKTLDEHNTNKAKYIN